MIPDEIISRVLNRADIVELIKEDLSLKQAGRAYKALCPFHNERTPSFFVIPRLSIYKCQGCGKSGDAISWLMETRGLDFPSAIRELGSKVGVTIPSGSPALDAKERAAIDRANDLRKVISHLHAYFREELKKNQAAMDYLRSRGLSDEMIERAELGYAPERYRVFGFTGQQFIDAGVASRVDGKPTWLFRNRIIFPIWDRSRKVIAFGARRMGEKGPKYINSAESQIYKKDRILSGLGRVRASASTVVVVEGYMDELTHNLKGIPALGLCGTALTPHQADLLISRYPKIVLMLDGDEAGRQATNRSLEILLSRIKPRTRIGVLSLPEGKDPDELLLSIGATEMIKGIEEAPDAFEYIFSIEPKGLSERAEYLDWLRDVQRSMPDGALKDLLANRLREAGVSMEGGKSSREIDRTGTDGGYYTTSPELRLAAIVLSFPDLVLKGHFVPDLMPEPACSLARAILKNPQLNAASLCRLMTAYWKERLEPLLSMTLEDQSGTDIEAAYLTACCISVRHAYMITKDREWRDRFDVLQDRIHDLSTEHPPTPIECLIDGKKDSLAIIPDAGSQDEEEEVLP